MLLFLFSQGISWSFNCGTSLRQWSLKIWLSCLGSGSDWFEELGSRWWFLMRIFMTECGGWNLEQMCCLKDFLTKRSWALLLKRILKSFSSFWVKIWLLPWLAFLFSLRKDCLSISRRARFLKVRLVLSNLALRTYWFWTRSDQSSLTRMVPLLWLVRRSRRRGFRNWLSLTSVVLKANLQKICLRLCSIFSRSSEVSCLQFLFIRRRQQFEQFVRSMKSTKPSRKHTKHFFPQQLSEHPTPKSNMISINKYGVHNQVYYIHPQKFNFSGESLDFKCLDSKKSKAQTQLFSMLMNDAVKRKSSKPNTNVTTPLNNSYNMRNQRSNNNSLQKRLEETYNLQGEIHQVQEFVEVALVYAQIAKLSKVIHLHPRYYDAYIYRGKLYLKQKNIDKALADFSISIQLSPNKGLGYLGKADCLRFLNNYDEAIKLYTKAIQSEQAISTAAMLKKAITYYENHEYDNALTDLDKLLQLDQSNSEAYYFKGLCKLKLKTPQEAILSFEQSIKHNNSKKAVTKSLHEIAKIKIDQRDFYAAYHTLNRSEFLDTEITYLEKFKLFTEAVIFLMKRKYTDSIHNFTQIQQNHTLNEYLAPLFFTYRAYGYFCLSKHQKALDDYKQLGDKVELSIVYNRLLCEGILKVDKGEYLKGTEYFKKASQIYPKKMEPLFYQSVTLIKQGKILEGLSLIDKAQHENANLYYIKAIVKGSLEDYEQAIMDIDKAIEKSEDNVPKYFFFRGMIYGCSKQFKQAANDFSICINLDSNYAEAYLEKAKCEFLYGDSTQAFSDLQQYISLQPDDPQIHVQAGNFLFANGAIEDAIKAYSHAPNFNEELLKLRCQCYMVLGQLDNCLEDVSQLGWAFDKDCLVSLKQVFTNDIYFNDEKEQIQLQKKLSQGLTSINHLIASQKQGELFKQHHLQIFKGVYLFHLQKYEDSLKHFSQAKNLKELSITEKRVQGLELTEEEEDADLLEILEIKFNELACLVMLRQYKKAKDKCRQLIENINETKQEGLQYLMVYLDGEMRKAEGKEYEELMSYERVICLYDEPKENPICFQVPIVFVHFLDDLKIRLSFSLPKISPPNLQPSFDKSLLENIGPLSVENKPEAPWIRREQQNEMIVFTDNIQMVDDIRLETEEGQEEEENLDKQEIKKQLMLDVDIEAKLKKILEKKQQEKR